MARPRSGSPRITLQITEADRATAIESNSGGCLIADALKRDGWSNPSVDMATIRVTDRKAGRRYVYLTPPAAQHALLSFDQGWPVEGVVEVHLQRAVKVSRMRTNATHKTTRAARLEHLEAKETAGTLTSHEKGALTRLRNNTAERSTANGPAEVNSDGTIIGGPPMPQGPAHPNLLRSRNRIYGAKLADPGRAFEQAVDAAVHDRNGE